MCAYLFVCTLVNALVLQGKTPLVQVEQCQDHFGHKYRSGMQQPNAACTSGPGTGEIHVKAWLCSTEPGQVATEGSSKCPDIRWPRIHACPRAPPATIPPSLTSTSSCPVIMCIIGPNITLLELTVRGNSKEAMRLARELEITNGLHRQGLNAKYDTIEIGPSLCIPHYATSEPTGSNGKASLTIGEIAIACPRSTFLARNTMEWRNPLLFPSIVTSNQPHAWT